MTENLKNFASGLKIPRLPRPAPSRTAIRAPASAARRRPPRTDIRPRRPLLDLTLALRGTAVRPRPQQYTSIRDEETALFFACSDIAVVVTTQNTERLQSTQHRHLPVLPSSTTVFTTKLLNLLAICSNLRQRTKGGGYWC